VGHNGPSGIGSSNGEIDASALFVGYSNSTVTMPNSDSLNSPRSAITLEAWVDPTTATGTVLAKSKPGSDYQYSLATSGTQAVFGLSLGGTYYTLTTATSSVPSSAWTFIVATYDGSTMRIYLNGSLSTSASHTGLIDNYSTSLVIGVGIGYFGGYIDEAAVFPSALGSTQVSDQYNAAGVGCVNISGATSQTYTVGAADIGSRLRVAVTATNSDGSAVATAESGLAFPFTAVPASWKRGPNRSAPGACRCPELVNSGTGDYHQATTDATVATFGPPLVFRRTYDSSLAQKQSTAGPLGYGWIDNWDMSLSVSSGVVTVTQAGSAAVDFYPPVIGSCPSQYRGSGATGTYCVLPDTTASLTFSSTTNTYTFTTHPYASYTFNSAGQLTGETSVGGASLSLTYNSPAPGSGACPGTANSCTTITSASGRKLVLAKNASGLIVKVIDPLSRAWTYGYCVPPSSTCSSGDLISVTDPLGNVTSFTYRQEQQQCGAHARSADDHQSERADGGSERGRQAG
jgi:hypothetical protein